MSNYSLFYILSTYASLFSLFTARSNFIKTQKIQLLSRIHIDCTLYIKNGIGSLENYAISDVKNGKCFVNFHPSTATTYESPPGLLIEIKRLNVPCDSGGYIIMGNRKKLCGKLEDISTTDRIHYYTTYVNASILLERSPIFTINYKLVDFCYNVTLSAQNSSIRLQPLRELECYFKIHLPYGNLIELSVYQNVHKIQNSVFPRDLHTDGDRTTILPALNYSVATTIDTETVDLTGPHSTEFVHFCTGIAIHIREITNTDSWRHCIDARDASKKFAFKSTGNALLIYVTKLVTDDSIHGMYNEHDNQHKNVDASVYIEYHAAPIPAIVSQCAFGWISFNTFCIAPFEQALAWKEAESHCRQLGGHLASIKSESEQQLIDALLMNR